MSAGGEIGFLETFTALSFLASQTTRIRLGSGICVVTQHTTVYTAKESAAIDWLSGGRFVFGVGVGLASGGVRGGQYALRAEGPTLRRRG